MPYTPPAHSGRAKASLMGGGIYVYDLTHHPWLRSGRAKASLLALGATASRVRVRLRYVF